MEKGMGNDMGKAALLVPIYEPEPCAIEFLKLFKEGDFDFFLIVNDGSGPEFDPIFQRIAEETVFTVVSYPKNRGKGHALKHGIALLKDEADPDFIVTADGDGQHAYDDILRVRDACRENPECLVMGNRLFDKKSVPLASKIGHVLANASFQATTRQKVSDTQTGLRGIPHNLFRLALETPGSRYDYEHDFLIDAAQQALIVNLGVKAIYIDKNANSHFRPVVDTLIIHKKFLLYLVASLASWGLDLGLFYLFSTYLFTANAEMQVYLSTLLARVISGFVNFLGLFFFVFDRRRSFGRKIRRYGILFLVNLGLSSTLTYAFKFVPTALTFVKFVVDAFISLVNYFIHRLWVFARKKAWRAKAKQDGKQP